MTTDLTKSKNLKSLKLKLREMFQLDQADLDFGIYRIMNAKRVEVEQFLDRDLLPQVRDALEQYQPTELTEKAKELDEAISNAKSLGIDPDSNEKVQHLREELKQGVDVDRLEEEVYSHMTTFFSRYYHGGDFMSLRRYKEGVYALPYEGEEVKLHWANADQYYIKSSESFQSYAFKVSVPFRAGMPLGSNVRRVRFDLASAGTEQNNVKATAGKERRFILDQNQPLAMDKDGDQDELIVRFQYRPDEEKRKQKDLNALAVEALLELPDEAPALVDISEWGFWKEALATKAPTAKNANRTVFEKQLSDYTAKNSFDYFIHKDLGGFLRRELDFFIKNEVMFLDDIESDTAPRVEQYLSKIRVLRSIAHKFIDFLGQLEDFQKKLWLKKKFVLETNWLVTLDKIPEDLFDTIAANEAQREEWVKLFAIDEIKGDLGGGVDYAEPLTLEFLKANPFLVLDTAFFNEEFNDELLASFEDIDEASNGLLVHGDNFQALNLLQDRYREQVSCTYIDPPYNKGDDGFMYKDAYQHSSWLSMVSDRLNAAHPFLGKKGVLFASIDEDARLHLEHTLINTFGAHNRVEELIWAQNSTKNKSPTYSTNHEYIEVFAKDKHEAKADFRRFRERKPGLEELQALIDEMMPLYLPVREVEEKIGLLYKANKKKFKDELAGAEPDESGPAEDWKGLYNYSNAEYRDSNSSLVNEAEAQQLNAKIWVWREGDPSMPQVKEDSQKTEFKDAKSPEFRFYKPLHPITGLPCPHPKTGWRWPRKPYGRQANCFDDLEEDNRIAWGDEDKKIPQVKRFAHETSTNVAKSVISDFTDGEKELSNLFGSSRVFSNPKPTTLIKRLVEQTSWSNHTVMDFFAGSGTTFQATIDANRQDDGERRILLFEMGEHFDSIVVPRAKKVLYSSNWKDGKPVSRDGLSFLAKYIRLESYEDCLDNLALTRTPDQQKLVGEHERFREDYMLRYMLDVEAKGSLLSIEAFADPFGYKLSVVRDDERKDVSVDLVETFNYLLGLRVKTRERVRDVLEITGTSPDGENVLILWRNVADKDNDALDEWFKKRGYNARDMEFDLIYVNGDNNIENLRKSNETWKVNLTEETFHTLMFDVEDV